jgi:DNA-binding transcriptional LysR family regulator
MALFHKKHADIKLQANVGNREMLVRQLHSNEIDLAIMGRPPERIDTLSYPFARHPHVVIASPDHPWARRSRIDPQELAEETFLVREQGSGTRAAMENFFREHGIDPPFGMTMESNETIKQAVMAGLGLGFISLHTIALELKTRQLVVLDVKDTPVMRTWYVVHLRSKRLSPATAAFKEFMLREAGPYLDSTFADTPVHIRNKLTRGERQPVSGIPPRITPRI